MERSGASLEIVVVRIMRENSLYWEFIFGNDSIRAYWNFKTYESKKNCTRDLLDLHAYKKCLFKLECSSVEKIRKFMNIEVNE